MHRSTVEALLPHFVEAGLPTSGGVQARAFKTGSVSGFANIQTPERPRKDKAAIDGVCIYN